MDHDGWMDGSGARFWRKGTALVGPTEAHLQVPAFAASYILSSNRELAGALPLSDSSAAKGHREAHVEIDRERCGRSKMSKGSGPSPASRCLIGFWV